MQLSEWILKTNKFLRDQRPNLPPDQVDELRDPKQFLLLDFDTQTLFTATTDFSQYPQVFDEPTVFYPPPLAMMFHGRPVLLNNDFQESAHSGASAQESNQIPKKQKSGYDWYKKPDEKLKEAFAIRAVLEEQQIDLSAMLSENQFENHHSDNSNYYPVNRSPRVVIMP